MIAQTPTATAYEELDYRENNGICVSLMWNRASNDVKVAVYDASTDSAFELAVGRQDPLDVFHHPFAYAAFRSVAYDALLLDTHDPIAA